MINTSNAATHHKTLISGYARDINSVSVGQSINTGIETGRNSKIKSGSTVNPDLARLDSKQPYQRRILSEDYKEYVQTALKGRSLIDRMVESMGAMNADESTTGRFLDIYV